ncbi:RcnB family protein [Pseudomonas sp. 6D_7.1_Bac1]|uniref:RcnB family protein n=1 Tax=Pseudomonas sp. 6D_7.1_Bac1 TaxID=2971615 RepID=UPI0021C8926C|nr:RcnB family protein [Pseudomonas sp. 6D_7.1_Bac1]MCU1750261.1 RcnB family protein [Pseudomonas sp. 6D_7.1_Bac1]
MADQKLMAILVLLASFGVVSSMALADDPVQASIQASPINARNLKVGDRAPDSYTSSNKALADWKKRGLKTPQSQSQWVQVNDKYMLVQTTNGQILAVMPIER